MLRLKPLLFSIFTALATAAFVLSSGCAKEYSYEQSPVDTSSIVTTPLPTQVPVLSSCALCNSAVLPDSSWQFSIDGVLFCGTDAKALVLGQGTSFTFFGPSACSSDSGFVATVELETEALDSDKANVRARLKCYYYDNITPSYMFMSPMGDYLNLTITKYTHQTRMAVGTFGGIVETESGLRKEIKDGRFRLQF